MLTRESGIDRRHVVEYYIRYECLKKALHTPDVAACDWSSADLIDRMLVQAKLKHGVIAGYLWWDRVDLSLDDLRRCAVERRIFPGRPQALALLEELGAVATWEPDRRTAWHEGVRAGHALGAEDALILRPAVHTEQPAESYLEDGSGRALALLANAHRYEAGSYVAMGFRGCVPDSGSSFMREHFAEILVSADTNRHQKRGR